MIALQQRLAARNLSDPSPPGWARVLFGTHPSGAERVGIARAYEEERPPDEPSGGAAAPGGGS